MPKAYLETTIVSYLAAQPSRDLIVSANQQITREWWEGRRRQFDVYISRLVVEECSGGDADAARRRMAIIADLPSLKVTDRVAALASALVREKAIPRSSSADALHIAVAAVHGIEYLLTWNMAHILNAELRPRIEATCRQEGFEPPVLCTPAELMGGPDVA